MEIYTAAHEHQEPASRPRIDSSSGQSLLLTENVRSIGGPPSLFAAMSQAERETRHQIRPPPGALSRQDAVQSGRHA